MTQTARLRPHNTVEILREVYGSEHLGIARIGARINDLKKLGHNIVAYHDPQNRKPYVYKLIPPEVPVMPPEPQNGSNTNQLQLI
jgi:hypothetical protein